MRALSVNGLRSTIALFGLNQPKKFEAEGVNIEHALRLITPGVGPVVLEKDTPPPLRLKTHQRHGNWRVFETDKLINALIAHGVLQLQTKTVVSSRVSPRSSRPPIAYEVPLRARLNIQRLQKFLAQSGNRLKINLRQRDEETQESMAYIDSLHLNDDSNYRFADSVGDLNHDRNYGPRDR